MSNLTQASHQWATRPADERFETLEDLYLNCFLASKTAQTVNVNVGKLEVVDENGDLKLATPKGVMGFNNWSFNQFAQRIGAPGNYLATLPSDLAARSLNVGINRNKELDAQLYFDGANNTTRAITSQSYSRIFNHEVVKTIIELEGNWQTPPARPAQLDQPGTRLATEADVLKYGSHPELGIKVGDPIAPAGLYGSDRDMFAFLVDPETQIDDGSGGGLSRGFFVRNSEVGNATFEFVTFLYRYVCGNHIVWGAEKVERVNIKHIGANARQRAFDKMKTALKAYRNAGANSDVEIIKLARTKEIGGTYEDLLDEVFGKRKLLPKNKVKAAYDKANEFADIDGSPRSFWGFSQGLTRLSQSSPFADERTMLDRAAGEIMDLVAATV